MYFFHFFHFFHFRLPSASNLDKQQSMQNHCDIRFGERKTQIISDSSNTIKYGADIRIADEKIMFEHFVIFSFSFHSYMLCTHATLSMILALHFFRCVCFRFTKWWWISEQFKYQFITWSSCCILCRRLLFFPIIYFVILYLLRNWHKDRIIQDYLFNVGNILPG